MKPSKFQVRIYEEIQLGKRNISVNAVAGSGKTTTIVESLKLIPPTKKILFSSFSNAIVDELKIRCPGYVHTTTLHSFGWRHLSEAFKGAKLQPNKSFIYAERILKRLVRRQDQYAYFFMVSKLVDLYRQNLVENISQLAALADKHNIFVDEEMLEYTTMVFMAMLDDKDSFDFNDMIFVPALSDDVRIPKYDYVFLDESQDCNLAQHKLVEKMLKKDSILVTVGDPNQSIYGFAGADENSFYRFAKRPNTISLPLSICYRCSKKIVYLAQTIVKEIEPYQGNSDGVLNTDASVAQIKEGDWVLCRNVRPLVSLCVDLIRKGKKAHVKGEDFSKTLINMLKSTEETKYERAIIKLLKRLDVIEEELRKKKVRDPSKHPKYLDFHEKISVIYYLGNGCVNTSQIVGKLERIFSDKEETGIQLMTIHKSKGLENNRIFLICPELIPSKYATQPWQVKQEKNLEYVAYTRAKKELYIVNDFTDEVIDFRIVIKKLKKLQDEASNGRIVERTKSNKRKTSGIEEDS